jgi:predicted nuclease with TOPRIM domain
MSSPIDGAPGAYAYMVEPHEIEYDGPEPDSLYIAEYEMEEIANLEKDKIKLQKKIASLERKNTKLESLHSKLKVKYNRVFNEFNDLKDILRQDIVSLEEETLGRTWSSEAVFKFPLVSKSVTFDESKNTIVA